jgi:L-iditol 2-dehydrogenase
MLGVTKTKAGIGALALTDRPEPRARAGYAVVEVHGAGICGTDLHIERGEYACCPPVTLGHEVAGVVVETDATNVKAWKGARVVSETYFSTCETCHNCRTGRPNLCDQRKSIGTHVDGAFASHLLVPIKNLHRIPDWLHEYAAALAEPLACVCNCLCDPTAVSPGDRVLVTGPGPIGLLAAQVARALGAAPVVMGLPSDTMRLETASKLGIEVVLAGEAVREIDVAIECSGHPAAVAAALTALIRGGGYVQIGIFGREVSIPMDMFLLKEISYRTGFASTPRSWRRAMSLIEKKLVAFDPLISAVASLNDWQAVFIDLRSSRSLKTVFDPRKGD